jgi:hypothetical protein
LVLVEEDSVWVFLGDFEALGFVVLPMVNWIGVGKGMLRGGTIGEGGRNDYGWKHVRKKKPEHQSEFGFQQVAR